jgi:hypothetical protein
MITADQLVAHAVGDYLIQSDWMANEKTKRSVAALAHALSYALPFLFITLSPLALAVIVGTHFAIDRWRLARFVVWAKNLPSPAAYRYPWSECAATGYHKDRPPWLAVWLLIIADNVLHVLINGAAIRWLS